jgi:preprotein translocase subunit SecE
MNSDIALQESNVDVLKLVLVLLLVTGGVVAFYYFGEQSQLLRVLGLLVVMGAAAGIGLTTTAGHRFLSFFKEAQIEVRKVVWPTAQETRRTTLAIVAVVVFIALFLWVLDWILGWAVHSLTI